MKKNIEVLDCTLRDGGYYNNWDFSLDLVRDYIKSISSSGIKYVELGFRSFPSKSFRGSNWYTTENYINSLHIPKNLKIAVMVNASEIINKKNLENAVKNLFVKKNTSKIDLVRVAFHLNEIDETVKIAKTLQKLGYKIGLNLMQISEISEKDLLIASKKISQSNADVFYFADSLGSLNAEQIKKIIRTIKINWKGDIGIHAHDNLGKAINNTKEAIFSGVKWTDCTITGMGRGPGNTQTENYLVEIENTFKKKFNILPILNVIKNYFRELKVKYGWGTNTYYYLAGLNGIHPTYIQEMLSTKFADAEILAAINQLKNSGGSRYNVDLVRSEFQKNLKLSNGTWSPLAQIKKREVLLVASGPKAKDYKNEIETYIKNKKPYVIAVNTDINIEKKLIDIYAACNPLKLIANTENYKNLKSPLAIPKTLINNSIKKKLNKIKVFDFGVGLEHNTFKFNKNGATLPRLFTLVYALSIATSGQAERILLAGFDGYGNNDIRTKTIDELLHLYSSSTGSRPLLAVTPTTYSINSTSIYAL
jgi:4-hydroxy 2-oxovalerate aldolase